jgi:hypothetical protein
MYKLDPAQRLARKIAFQRMMDNLKASCEKTLLDETRLDAARETLKGCGIDPTTERVEGFVYGFHTAATASAATISILSELKDKGDEQ